MKDHKQYIKKKMADRQVAILMQLSFLFCWQQSAYLKNVHEEYKSVN